MEAQDVAKPRLASDTVGCSGNFLFFSIPIEHMFVCENIPFSKKISLLHSHVLFLLCVELNLVLVMGLAGFYFCCVYNKAFAVPAFVIPFKSMGCGFLSVLVSKVWGGECYRSTH